MILDATVENLLLLSGFDVVTIVFAPAFAALRREVWGQFGGIVDSERGLMKTTCSTVICRLD